VLAPVISAILQLREQIGIYPRTAQNYGLIHDDLHTGNVLNLSGRRFILDFDQLHYSWFAADIASTLLFRVWIGPKKDQPELQSAATGFFRELLRGYPLHETPLVKSNDNVTEVAD
jgi:Ser/Thr protein kinase RdoA (MazF antagonist)